MYIKSSNNKEGIKFDNIKQKVLAKLPRRIFNFCLDIMVYA